MLGAWIAESSGASARSAVVAEASTRLLSAAAELAYAGDRGSLVTALEATVTCLRAALSDQASHRVALP
jgi:hypothetical protein